MSAPTLTSADLVGKIGVSLLAQLTDDAPGATDPDDDVIGECSAEGWKTDIWTRLRQVYKEPPTCPDGSLKGIWTDVTVYRLHLRHTEFLSIEPGQPKHWARQRYEDAIALLDKVAKGDAAIEGLTLATEDEVQGAGGWFSNDLVYNKLNFRGF